MTLAGKHIKWSMILMDLLGPDIFSTLWMKGQVLQRERVHLKVPEWSLVWNELLTKKLPMFLSRFKVFKNRFNYKLQTAEKENTDRIPLTLTFHPYNPAVKSIILKTLNYNIARVLALYKSYWAAMNKIFIYARPCVNEMTWAMQCRRKLQVSCSLSSPIVPCTAA